MNMACKNLLPQSKFLPLRMVVRRRVGDISRNGFVQSTSGATTYDPLESKRGNTFFCQEKRSYSIYTQNELIRRSDGRSTKNESSYEREHKCDELTIHNDTYSETHKVELHGKILSDLISLRRMQNRDCEKLKLISQYIFRNINLYSLYEIADILKCTNYFSIILKKEDLHKLVKRLKILTFNKKEEEKVMYEIIPNLLRIKVAREYQDKALICTLTTFINDLLRFWLILPRSDMSIPTPSYISYVYFVKEVQLIILNQFCSWLDKKYVDNSVFTFLQSFQSSVGRKNRHLDYLFVKEVSEILLKLNCKIRALNTYNYSVPIFVKDFYLIVECIGNNDTFQGTLTLTPYFSERYELFKKLGFKVLHLYKQLLPSDAEDKLNYVKQSLYSIIK
ncbi:conserved Plasmodium protein, unknown function [Plasmodium knowlesi strain H]|uniref:RAP protein n=3 Tax=Plasmodium knowlesi TaxID=5850 RepID=A0A1A7W3M5_PLAKH|nr:conserved Plasmodium protein, unknown function [Plasmodium knowlesi strain H]OTN66820.1 Uncharacterized protein PKNOH_S08479300 [Plasmodium knowlesi]CAA9990117.1 conserved Plasmodium protein, unknown function [Plasmodium knowlesi strain H]SBO25797.1 conserved Plasmodium protein, unknown function [Plasmodium knowlesi strain H]SBO28590.1 conserved Plasmodium protein, unknown function [Plasmodium knowlesi strain H]VVS79591.1 conserved Plasmodium protein, unknown function [Plasmodium knowlesi s